MRRSRSSALPETGDAGTSTARSLLVPRLMGVVGVLTLLASFGLMAASAPVHAGARGPHVPQARPASCPVAAPARLHPPMC
jgi:hypothetical protein